MEQLGAPLARVSASKCSKLNSEGGSRIGRVDLPYIPLPEVIAHAFNEKMVLDPAHKVNYKSLALNTKMCHMMFIWVETSLGCS